MAPTGRRGKPACTARAAARRVAVALLAVLVSACSPSVERPGPPARELKGHGPFLDLSVQQAEDLARRQAKLLLIAFYAEDCEPCDQWDRVTLADEDVRHWIADRTVAVLLHERDGAALAARHAIGPRPTFLFLDPAGAVVGQLDGFLEPQEFLAEVRAMDPGPGSTPRSAVASGQAATGLAQRVDRGRALRGEGRAREALDDFLWVFDNSRDDPVWASARLQGLLAEIEQLADSLPEARGALRERRDQAAATLLEPRATAGPDPDLLIAAREVVALDRSLGDLEHAWRTWRALAPREDVPSEVVAALFGDDLQVYLLSLGRYGDFLEGVGDPIAGLESRLGRLHSRQPLAELDAGRRADIASERNAVVNFAGRCYEALLGLQREGTADGLAQFLLELEPTAQSYVTLFVAAGNAGRPDLARALAESGQATLTGSEREILGAMQESLLPAGD